MPSKAVELKTTSDTVIVKPPSNRKVKVTFSSVYNADTADHVVTLKAVTYDSAGNVLNERTIRVIFIATTQTEALVGESIYDLDRGEALVGALDTAATNPVHVSVTYKLE